VARSKAEAKARAPEPLVVERRGAALTIGIDRPHKRNALERIFSDIPDGVRAMVLHGFGPNFSAGLDLNGVGDRDVASAVNHSRAWRRCFEKIEFGPVPVVAVLKGAVIGGGLELATADENAALAFWQRAIGGRLGDADMSGGGELKPAAEGEQLAIEAWETLVWVGRHPHDPARLESRPIPPLAAARLLGSNEAKHGG
jgi:hypothetical protein